MDIQEVIDSSQHHLVQEGALAVLRWHSPASDSGRRRLFTCAPFRFLLLDLAVTVYQAVCFPVYGIPKVARGEYLVFDRGSLRYLNVIEKIGCVYCSYANGLLAYVVEIAARTEQHFCPIKHARKLLRPHSHYANFVPYGDLTWHIEI